MFAAPAPLSQAWERGWGRGHGFSIAHPDSPHPALTSGSGSPLPNLGEGLGERARVFDRTSMQPSPRPHLWFRLPSPKLGRGVGGEGTGFRSHTHAALTPPSPSVPAPLSQTWERGWGRGHGFSIAHPHSPHPALTFGSGSPLPNLGEGLGERARVDDPHLALRFATGSIADC
jgi:hypothetical protein